MNSVRKENVSHGHVVRFREGNPLGVQACTMTGNDPEKEFDK
jgi:hypothetical protein